MRRWNYKSFALGLEAPFLVLVMALVGFTPANSFGDEASDRRKARKEERERRKAREVKIKSSGPCKVIRDACRHAGFSKDGPRGKDMKRDCEQPLLLGLSVPGVHLLPAIIDSCKRNEALEN